MEKLFRKILFFIARFPMSGYTRAGLFRLAGVNIGKHVFIGEDVVMDSVYPEKIFIGEGTTVATGCVILTHYIDMDFPGPGFKFYSGSVRIGRNSFIGAKSIITKPISIGNDCIISAGAVVTHCVPSYEVWGVPAKCISTRKGKE